MTAPIVTVGVIVALLLVRLGSTSADFVSAVLASMKVANVVAFCKPSILVSTVAKAAVNGSLKVKTTLEPAGTGTVVSGRSVVRVPFQCKPLAEILSRSAVTVRSTVVVKVAVVLTRTEVPVRRTGEPTVT
jgi:hypothetical protein